MPSPSHSLRSSQIFVFILFIGLQLVDGSLLRPRAAPVNSTWPFHSYQTVPYHPPQLKISKSGPTDDGYLVFAPDGATADQTAPLIMTDTNELVWQGPKGHAFALSVQSYRGQQVLAYWNGTVFPEPIGRGYGSIHILNSSYDNIATVSLPGNFITANGSKYPSNVDLHEIYITENNTVLVTANNVTQTDLRSVGGPQSGWVVDGLVYEIDIATNKVLFRWSALEHVAEIPLNSSVYPLGTEGFNGTKQASAWGYFHINAVSPYDGGYLLSSRYLCSALAIDRQGQLKWRLQGRDGGDFDLGPGANFCYQHDVRAFNTAPTSLSLRMHDNANCPTDNGTVPSSGLVLDLNLATKQATLNRRLRNASDPIFSPAQGNYQPLPQHDHTFVGHGWIPKLEEFDNATGQPVMTVQFGQPGSNVSTLSYRAFRSPWHGCPSTPPALLINTTSSSSPGDLEVYMSWNGATEYDGWNVYGGNTTDPESMKIITSVAKSGFETNVTVPATTAKYLRVQAVVLFDHGTKSVCAGGPNSMSAVVTVG